MFAVDLHAHTRFFHGFGPRATAFDPVGARLLARFARRRALDGVALTNHDYRFDRDSPRPVFLPGIEISSTRGHVLVVGPDPPTTTNAGTITARDAVALAHDHDCAAIMAHPFRNGDLPDSEAPFDAIEVNGKHPEYRPRAKALAEERGLPMVGGSDAHYPFEVGRAFTRIDAPNLSPRSVVDAIRDGRVEPAIDSTSTDRLVQHGYDIVHRLKGDVREEPDPVGPPESGR